MLDGSTLKVLHFYKYKLITL